LGQLEAIGGIASTKLLAIRGLSAVSGGWPTPYYRQYPFSSELGQFNAIDIAPLMIGWANSRLSACIASPKLLAIRGLSAVSSGRPTRGHRRHCFSAIREISAVSGGWPTPCYRQYPISSDLGQFNAIDIASLVIGWANSRLSAELPLPNSWPLEGYRQYLAVGQLEAIGDIASQKLLAIRGLSAVSGGWPTPCYRQYPISSDLGQFNAIDIASLVIGWANSRLSAAMPLPNSWPLKGYRRYLAVGQPHAIDSIPLAVSLANSMPSTLPL
jgi:hypothetical protein